MLRSVSDIGENKTLTPNGELPRINAVVANRRLYEGDFRELGLGRVSSTVKGLSVNWFRKVAIFYPEFMFSEVPEIVIEGNQRATEAIQAEIPQMVDAIMQATQNMIRFGLGVITTTFDNPLRFISIDRDRHYEVGDSLENISHDIFYKVVGSATDPQLIANVYRYGVDGSAILEQFNYNHGNLGAKINTVPIPQRAALRQAVFLENVREEGNSVFDLIKGPVGQMSRAATAVAKNVNRNSHPHLYGPDTMLTRDEAGRVSIDNNGMFLPLSQGDDAPGYLQWDSNIEAIKWSYEESEALVYSFTGLSKLLFSSSVNTGALSGIALRRSLIPFISRLNGFGREAIEGMKSMVMIYNENRRVLGQEYFQIARDDIEVTLNYDRIFVDAEEQPQGGPESPTVPLTGAGDLTS